MTLRTASRQVRLVTCLVAALALLGSCEGRSGALPPVDEWTIRGGGAVRTLLPAAGDTAVLLVYTPSHCFSCNGELSRWIGLSRERGWQLRLLLTAPPSPGERDQLRLFRLEPAGVLQGAAARVRTPRVYRFSGQVVVDSAVGSTGEHRLLGASTGPDAGR